MLDCCQIFARIEDDFYRWGIDPESEVWDELLSDEDEEEWREVKAGRRLPMDLVVTALQYQQGRDRKRIVRDTENARLYQQRGGREDGPDSGEQAGHQAATEAPDPAGETEPEELRGSAEAEP